VNASNYVILVRSFETRHYDYNWISLWRLFTWQNLFISSRNLLFCGIHVHDCVYYNFPYILICWPRCLRLRPVYIFAVNFNSKSIKRRAAGWSARFRLRTLQDLSPYPQRPLKLWRPPNQSVPRAFSGGWSYTFTPSYNKRNLRGLSPRANYLYTDQAAADSWHNA
jgi:hypothetical protein